MLNELFDLVAPIAICGGADICYNAKAKAAWKKIAEKDPAVWVQHGCPVPPNVDYEDFDTIYRQFALPAYNALFEALVEEHGPANLEKGRDYWGALGYRLPHQTSKQFELSGDACGFYPWYETAEVLIERLAEIES